MKKLLALLMAAAMLFAFAACGDDKKEDETTTETTTQNVAANVDSEETTADDGEEETEEVTEVVTDESGEAVTDKEGHAVTEKVTKKENEKSTKKNNSTKKDNSTKKTSATSSKPSTKAEVVEYFNTAVNKIKTSAKSVKQNYVTNYLSSTPTLSSGIKSVYNMLGGDDWLDKTLKDNSTGADTYTGSDIKNKYPVEGESWASKLTAADVSSATCTESNGVYTIKITTLADSKSASVKHGQGHNPKAFNVPLPETINANIPGIATGLVGTASMNYPASTIVVTVDASTGLVKTAEYDLKWTINFDKMNVVLPLGCKSSFTINW